MKGWLGMFSAAVALVASPAHAACWTDVAYEAAQIRDLETKMMVSMLRCRISGNDFTETYNSFVRSKRTVLQEANGQLRDQFAKSVGPIKALGAYDDYMTKVANSYGAGGDGLTCQESRMMTEVAARDVSNRSELLELAGEMGVRPQVPGGRCSVTLALRDK